MKLKILLLSIVVLMQSCSVYHITETKDNQKFHQVGVSFKNNVDKSPLSEDLIK